MIGQPNDKQDSREISPNPGSDMEDEGMDQFIEDTMNDHYEGLKSDARDDLNTLFAHVPRGEDAFVAAYKEFLRKKREGSEEGGA